MDNAVARAPSKADQPIEEIHKQGLGNPVEILPFLDVTSESELKEGISSLKVA